MDLQNYKVNSPKDINVHEQSITDQINDRNHVMLMKNVCKQIGEKKSVDMFEKDLIRTRDNVFTNLLYVLQEKIDIQYLEVDLKAIMELLKLGCYIKYEQFVLIINSLSLGQTSLHHMILVIVSKIIESQPEAAEYFVKDTVQSSMFISLYSRKIGGFMQDIAQAIIKSSTEVCDMLIINGFVDSLEKGIINHYEEFGIDVNYFIVVINILITIVENCSPNVVLIQSITELALKFMTPEVFLSENNGVALKCVEIFISILPRYDYDFLVQEFYDYFPVLVDILPKVDQRTTITVLNQIKAAVSPPHRMIIAPDLIQLIIDCIPNWQPERFGYKAISNFIDVLYYVLGQQPNTFALLVSNNIFKHIEDVLVYGIYEDKMPVIKLLSRLCDPLFWPEIAPYFYEKNLLIEIGETLMSSIGHPDFQIIYYGLMAALFQIISNQNQYNGFIEQFLETDFLNIFEGYEQINDVEIAQQIQILVSHIQEITGVS